MIDLHILGEIRLFSADGQELDTLLRQPKRLALLAYVASPCPGTWHRRDMLLALFWPELDTAHARTSLRNAIYVLRRALGDEVVRNRGDEEISIDPTLLQTDLAGVWYALRNSSPEEALSRYNGELLPGLFPSDCEGFLRWLDSERARLKTAVTTAVTARLDELEKLGSRAEALALARRIIAIQPDDETIVRRVMTLHDSLGDRAGALGVFERYRSRLAGDFDADPAPETLALASRLRESVPISPRNSARMALPKGAIAEPWEKPTAMEYLAIDAGGSATRSRYRVAIAVVLVALAISGVTGWRLTRTARPLSIGTSLPLTADEGLQIEAALSPNGRLVAYAKGNMIRLRIYIQRIGEGSPWPLTNDSTAVELLPRWSPDNDQLLFLSRNNAYAAPSNGGAPQLIARGTEGDGMVRSASWSPGGDSVAIVQHDSLTVQPIRRGGRRFIGRGNQLHSCVWSPLNTWIACVAGNWLAYTPGPVFGNDAPSAIVLYPVAGGRAVELTGSAFENKGPEWSADGRFLWILSDRDGAAGEVYAVPIGDDGHASGEFIRVGLKAESIGMSEGRIVYSVSSRKANLWAVPIPKDTGMVLSSPKAVTTGNQVIEVPSVSRDGKWIVYDSNLKGDADIYRIPVNGGVPERLTDDPRPEFAGDLSPDGRELVWHRWMHGERRLFVKSIGGGTEQEIIPAPGDQGVAHWSPDGSAIAAWSHDTEQGAVFVVRRDAQHQWRHPSWRLKGARIPVWSPDGRTIAFVRFDGGVETIPADSGAQHEIYAPRAMSDDPLALELRWSADTGIIYMRANNPRDGVWALPVNGGRPRLLLRLPEDSKVSFGPTINATRSTFFLTLDERTANLRWAELVKR